MYYTTYIFETCEGKAMLSNCAQTFFKKKKKGYREFFLRIILKTCHYSKTNLKH